MMSFMPRVLMILAVWVGLGGLPTSACPNPGSAGTGGPCLDVLIHGDGDVLELSAHGPSNALAGLRVQFSEGKVGVDPTQTFLLPFTFDQHGDWSLSLDLAGFINFGPFELVVQVEYWDAAAGSMQTSLEWGLQMDRQILDKELEAFLNAGSGSGQWQAALPGTGGPTYTVSYGSVVTPGRHGLPMQEVLLFLAGPYSYLQTVPGIEGVFPVN